MLYLRIIIYYKILQNMENYMNITITDKAKEKILEAFKSADLKSPGLRLVFSGVG